MCRGIVRCILPETCKNPKVYFSLTYLLKKTVVTTRITLIPIEKSPCLLKILMRMIGTDLQNFVVGRHGP